MNLERLRGRPLLPQIEQYGRCVPLTSDNIEREFLAKFPQAAGLLLRMPVRTPRAELTGPFATK